MKPTRSSQVIVALLIGAVLTLIYFGQSIIAGKSLYFQMSEELFPLHANYPWDELISRTYHEGHFPLWNPYGGLGAPLLGNYLSGALSPLKLLIYAWPSNITRELYVFMRFALGAGFMIVFCRRFKMGWPASLFGAIAFAFSGYFGTFHNETYLNAELLLPLWLLAGDHFAKSQTIRSASWLAFAVAAIILNGHPEAAFHTLLFLALFIVFRLKRFSAKTLFSSAIPFIGGFIISAALLLPFVEAFSQSFNFHPTGVGRFHYDLKHLLSLALPWFWGDQQFYLSIKNMPGYEIVSGMEGLSYTKTQLNWFPPYIGTLSMAFAGFALLNIRRFGSTATFFALYAIVFTAATFGLPIFTKLFHLPLFSSGGNYKHCYPEITFCVAVLAGFLIDHKTLIQHYLKHILFVMALVIFILIFFPYFVAHHDPSKAKEVCNVAALFLGLSIIPLFAQKYGQKRFSFIVYILPFILFSELIISSEGFHRTLKIEPIKLDTNRIIRWFKDFYPFSRFTSYTRLIDPNFSAKIGIFDIRTHDALYPQRFVESMYCLNGEDIVQGTNRYNYSGHISPTPLSFSSSYLSVLDIENFDNPSNPSSLSLLFDILSHSEIRTLDQQHVMYVPISRLHPNSGYISIPVNLAGLYAHSPTLILYPNKKRYDISFLPFYGSPKPANTNKLPEGDGVFFDIYCLDGAEDKRLFSVLLDTPVPYFFAPAPIKLNSKSCEQIKFITHPVKSIKNDTSYWADLITQKDGNKFRSKNVFSLTSVLWKSIYKTNRTNFALKIASSEISHAKYCDMIWKDHDFSASALIENDGKLFSHELTVTENKPVISNYLTDQVDIKVAPEEDGYLILADMYYPGWRAFAGDEERRILPANRLARAVEIKKGDSRISFVYEPVSFKIGLYASIVSMIFCLGIITISRSRKP